jgi:hypothetical protein
MPAIAAHHTEPVDPAAADLYEQMEYDYLQSAYGAVTDVDTPDPSFSSDESKEEFSAHA